MQYFIPILSLYTLNQEDLYTLDLISEDWIILICVFLNHFTIDKLSVDIFTMDLSTMNLALNPVMIFQGRDKEILWKIHYR